MKKKKILLDLPEKIQKEINKYILESKKKIDSLKKDDMEKCFKEINLDEIQFIVVNKIWELFGFTKKQIKKKIFEDFEK